VDDPLGEERLGLLNGGFDLLEVVGGEGAGIAGEPQSLVKGGGVDDDEIVFADREAFELEGGALRVSDLALVNFLGFSVGMARICSMGSAGLAMRPLSPPAFAGSGLV
jgi:hypothetical protein